MIIDVKKSISKDMAKLFIKGSTGRTVANNWKERKAMMQVMKNPEDGTEVIFRKKGSMTDPLTNV